MRIEHIMGRCAESAYIRVTTIDYDTMLVCCTLVPESLFHDVGMPAIEGAQKENLGQIEKEIYKRFGPKVSPGPADKLLEVEK